ncbi:hypothetical protein QTP70_021805, partial [Hemibagrus guttatus]
KGRELADVMERRKVDILCVQETRWKGSKARSIGAGFKLFYYGVDSKRNGVGVVLKEEFVRNVLEVKRVSDRVMSLKLEIEGVMLNVVSGYAPQVGCELEEKERFWSELDEVMESIPTGERVVIGADFNGHVGEGNTGDEEVMGKFGVKERNLEGQMVVDFAKRMDMGVVNTYFQKREEHRVTYKSGGRRTQVDYILCRRGNLKEISDCKVVVGESVARQHRMVVCRMTLMVCKTKRSKIEKKTKWWKLKKEECCEEFRQKLRQALGGQVVLPDDWETTAEVIRETGRKVLGVSSGRRKEDKETWWWNEEVQDSIQRKRLAKKKWDMDRTEENRQEYKELQRRVKREVSKAKQKAYDELYTRLDTREGEKDLYRLARQRDRDGKDVQQVRVIKDRDGRVLTSEESVQRRWKEYFEELMNEENEREKRVEGVNSVEQKVDKIRKDEVRKALKRMKSGKAVGPDDIPVEVWKCLGEAAVEFLANLFNRVLESERMPEEWRRSVLVPIFKNKGDVQSCSNYRGIKLMSHTMKVWERVVEARLRKVVDICEQQYGFMPRKSTTDAIFALRILMEKYRDGQKELHCVFVDLEKAYDRVPREELWYCMRKSGVAEKYVRVVQDMYERSRTVVRCAVGQTEEFNVEVGLHQGSALSPFLFAIVMDQLSEEVRQESPWTMMFADDIVICSESREQVEENLERWRFALERRGMKVSRSKTEYMCVNEREGSGTVRLQGEEVKKVQEFKYLGSTVQSNGECGKEVKKRVQAGWNGWRKVSGVLCDQKISARIKGKVYRTVVRPAMLYGLETVSLRKRQESELEVAELKMLRFSLGVTRLDRIRNEYIRGTAHVGRLGDKVREARLRWFGHVQRRENKIEEAQKELKEPRGAQKGYTAVQSQSIEFSSHCACGNVLAQQNALLNENCGKAKPESQSNHELDSSKAEPRRVKIFDGGYKSNEEYVYVRGRGRGKYICEECGIRCKKPSMLRKHIRTHSDVRPYHCAQCNFSFKTKGNLTKHMKSKAHSKKCMEMGVAIGVIEDHETEDSGGDHGRAGNADRPDSDGDDSDGPDDEDNDGEEEDEEDSQAESGLSATPSVSASPQHLQSSQTDPAPSSLLAQMSISPNPNPTPLPQIPGSYSQALDTDSVVITSSVSLVRQMSNSAVCSSHGPSPSSFVPYPTPTSESNSSDTESVHMMSPVSPCRQMSIDYPDPDVPPSPPMPSKNSLSGQDESTTSNSQTTNESNSNVDRSTQTTSDSLQGSLHFPSLGPDHELGTGATTRLFSHLPLHSQQPTRSPHSMVPVGGIQLVPAGLAAYSTFVPIQAGPVQLTIPAVSVIHRQASSPLPVSNMSPQPQGSPCQPLVVQEPINSVLPCFPFGQVAGLQTLSAPQATLQPVGMETLSVVGLANSTHLVPQQNLALNAALGVQVLAASPAPQSSTASPGHISGLQILNIALPALIPSLSPLSALSPLVPDKPGSPEGVASVSLPTQVAESPPATSPSGSFPTAWPAATPVAVVPVAVKPLVEMTSPSKPTRSGKDIVLSTIDSEKAKSTQPHPSSSTEGESVSAQKASSVEVGEARLPRQPITRQQVIDDFNNASSDDEDRLVIAT